jgi:hypothetical protein
MREWLPDDDLGSALDAMASLSNLAARDVSELAAIVKNRLKRIQ